MQKPFQSVIVVSLLLGALVLGGCDSPKQQGGTSTTSTSSTSTTSGDTTSTISTSSTSTTSTDATSNQFPGLPRLNGRATVVMTVQGNKQITIELDGNNAPISAGNFADLVQKGFYNGLNFHRVVRQPQPFVVQGGDPKGNGTGGYVPSGASTERRIPLEIKPKGGSTPVYSQTITEVPELQHKRGTIAMARSQPTDSASSQFYFTLADIAFLDGNYAVFGKITKGLEIIDTIQQGDKITSARVTQGIGNLKK
jgi:peptidyl-prolyl cis-trans isomerase B (cyclophilin B)